MNRRSGKNPARKRIGRLMPQLRAAPDLHASRPKPHLATGQRQGHPDEVGPLEARDPTSSKLRAAEKNSEPPKIFSEPPSFFSEPRKIFSEPRSLGEPFSSFYRDTSEYAFCRNPIPYTGATASSSRAARPAPQQYLHTRSSALRISAATGVARQTPSHATRRQGSSSRAARPATRQCLYAPQQILTHQHDTGCTLTGARPYAAPPRRRTKRQKDTRKSRKKVKKQKKCFALCGSSANFAPVYSKKRSS